MSCVWSLWRRRRHPEVVGLRVVPHPRGIRAHAQEAEGVLGEGVEPAGLAVQRARPGTLA